MALSIGSPLLSANAIKKSFKQVEVLHGVDFDLRSGEVHGVVGQNGAGKSTLMKIINGVYTKDDGTITINGQDVELGSPIAASQQGIAMVFQEFSLVPSMTVSQNLFLTREPTNRGFIDEKIIKQRSMNVFNELDVDISPDQELGKLPVGSKQIVEIAKALIQDAKILILDEPTASLSSVEIESLFAVIRRLKQEGIGIVFVSHHLNEVMEICDRVTIIRDGNVSLSESVSNIDLQEIITAMIGKKLVLGEVAERNKIDRTQPLLEVRQLSSEDRFKNVSFSLFPGEILGIAGVLGSGRSELLKTIYGILKKESGDINLVGEPLMVDHPEKAIRSGVFLVPEDRRKDGIVSGQSLRSNVLLPIWKRLRSLFFIQDDKGETIVKRYVDDLNIAATGIDQLIERLSGGNQQKVVFAKSLATEPRVLLLDDPTVGVDIGTKKEIAQIIRGIVSRGNGVVFVSSEMEEIASLCDRVLVMRRGEIIEELDCREEPVTEGSLMHSIHGNSN